MRHINWKHHHPYFWGSFLGYLATFLMILSACEDARRIDLNLSPQFTPEIEPSLSGGEMISEAGVFSAGESMMMAGDQGGEMIQGGEAQVSPLIPGPATWSRLTRPQYLNMVSDVLGVDASDLELEPDTNPYLFTSIGATESTLSALGAERYAEAAIQISQRYFEQTDRIEIDLGCLPSSLDDGCTDQWIRWIGLRLYRRLLTEAEVTKWREHARAIVNLGGDRNVGSIRLEPTLFGLQWVLAGMLQAPQTLYRLELGEPHPNLAGTFRYTSLEMASRLAFTIQNTTPSPDLIQAGLDGALTDSERLAVAIDQLLETPSARTAVGEFFAQYLDLARLKKVERDPNRYPNFAPPLLEAMELEIRLLVDELVFRERADIRTLFNQRRAYVNSTLANHYGLNLELGSPILFEPIELDADSPRVGILGLGAFLTMNAHPTETSPTLRGKYIRERLFCQEVPPPPDNIDLNLEQETGEATTLRERLEQHRENPACFGCHQFIDPPGLIFENFDSVGRYRETLDGVPLDSRSEIDGVTIQTVGELAELVVNDPKLTQCMVRQLYRFAQGRLETEGEEGELIRLHRRFATEGFRFHRLLRALALSNGFRSFSPRNEEAEP